ncbi:MAG: hypothetical protein JNG83_14665 [Opitutaceae bacterium]|nr:hypothetical protein [Opitutaceae bacterium]
MHVELFALCDAATDQAGKLNILGTFDTIHVQGFPAAHPSCAVAGRIRFELSEQGSHEFKLSIIDQDGTSLVQPVNGKFPVKANPGAGTPTVNLVLNFQGLQIKQAGEYRIDLNVDNRVVATLPLYVKLITAGSFGR